MNPIPLFSPNILKMNRRFFRTQLIIERKPRELTRFGELILSFNTFSPKLISMPIDINLLRVSRGGNPDLVRQSQRNRYASVELVDEVIELDDVDFLDVDYCRNGEL